MNNKLSKFLQIANYINILIGFALISVIPDLIGEESRNVTVPYRAFTLFLAIVSIIIFIWLGLRIRQTKLFVIYLFFWVMIFVRLFFDLEIREITTVIDPSYYFSFGFGAIFIPSLPLFFGIDQASLRKIRTISLIGLFISGILCLFVGMNYLHSISSVAFDVSRIRSHVLSPISIGNIGVTLIILSITNIPTQKTVIRFLPRLFCILLGICLLALSGSRGPFIELVLCLLLLVLYQTSVTRFLKRLSLILILGLVVYFIFVNIEEFSTFKPLTRIEGISQFSTDVSIMNRLSRYESATEQFFENPIFGNSIVVSTTNDYPHNIFLESFMAFGVIGGSLFVLISIMAIKSSLHLLKLKENSWVSLLFFQFFMASMFSGSLFTNSNFWFWTIIPVVVCCRNRQSEKNTNFE